MKNIIELDKTLDCSFKAIMCHPNNRKMVANVLSAITGINVDDLVNATYIGGEEISKRIFTQKKQVTDLTVNVKDKLKISVEMNRKYAKNLFERNTLYAMAKTIEHTDRNAAYYPTVLLINIDSFNKYKTKEALLHFKSRDEFGHIESEVYNSTHLILDNCLNKNYNEKEEIKKFAKFLKENNIETLNSEFKGDVDYMSAIRTVEELSKDPEFAGYYDYEKAHQRELEDYRETGYDEGYEVGTKEATHAANIETAKDMLKDNKPINEIIKYSHLTKEEIVNLKKKLDN